MKLSDLFSNYYTIRSEMISAVESLSPEQLAWTAPDHSNSIGKLLAHIAETEYWWIAVVAEKSIEYDQVDWIRFDRDLPIDELLAMLDENKALFDSYLNRTSSDEWDSIFYDIPGRSEKVSMRWLSWHVVEHQARHRGQIFMLMRMQSLEVPNV